MQFSAEPLSRNDIRNYANKIRKQLGLDKNLMFPAVPFIEALPFLIGDDELCFAVLDDNQFPMDVHAYYDLDENCIKVRESVYLGACSGNGRDRMTLVHEGGHVLFLKHSNMKFNRSFASNVPCCEDPEWHAKCFAGEIMIPADLVKGLSPTTVAQECGVSLAAAKYQLSKIS